MLSSTVVSRAQLFVVGSATDYLLCSANGRTLPLRMAGLGLPLVALGRSFSNRTTCGALVFQREVFPAPFFRTRVDWHICKARGHTDNFSCLATASMFLRALGVPVCCCLLLGRSHGQLVVPKSTTKRPTHSNMPSVSFQRA